MTIKKTEGGVCAPAGFSASGMHSGIRKNPNKKDLGLIYSNSKCICAGVFTTNKTKAAPVIVSQEHANSPNVQAIICNSGNANACTHNGIEIANEMCMLVGSELGIESDCVLVASTGVIGVPMKIEPIAENISSLCNARSVDGNIDFSSAIMTTDLTIKEIAYEIIFSDGSKARIGATAKGSGMIHPNMATMLGFITTDVNISKELLSDSLCKICEESFNMVSVDGDTSTNDMVFLLANGESGSSKIENKSDKYFEFYSALKAVCTYLAISIAKDGEGASKLLTINVSGAKNTIIARSLAKSIALSPLVKTAIFGADANWGRVICALGNAGCDFDPNAVDIWFRSTGGDVNVCKNGMGVNFSEEKARTILSQSEISIDVVLNEGESCATAWGCDLTYDYIKINGDYRS